MTADATSLTVLQNVTCTGCGCICDDLSLTTQGVRIVATKNACRLVETTFLEQHQFHPPAARLSGKDVTVELAIAESVRILSQSRMPLVFGLSRSCTEGQRAAIALADELGATIDTTASLGHGASILALQQVGESTSSLGEVRERADLIIYWGADPETTHPRHIERYAIPTAQRASRRLIVIDQTRTATAELADEFIPIPADRVYEAITLLRGFVRGLPMNMARCEDLPVAQLLQLAELMKTCRSGVVFFGYGVSRQPQGHRHVQALLQLVTELQEFTCFYARRLRVTGDVAGADSVLCWQTGYPFAVNLSRGFPRYGPGEFSANDVLERGEADAAVLVGSDQVPLFSPAARAHLARIPTIVLDYPHVACPFPPTVQFTTAVYGIHHHGTVYRMDEVPLPLTTVVPTNYPTDAAVLNRIQSQLN